MSLVATSTRSRQQQTPLPCCSSQPHLPSQGLLPSVNFSVCSEPLICFPETIPTSFRTAFGLLEKTWVVTVKWLQEQCRRIWKLKTHSGPGAPPGASSTHLRTIPSSLQLNKSQPPGKTSSSNPLFQGVSKLL